MKEREFHITIHSLSRFLIAMIVILLTSISFILNKLPSTEYEIISIIQFVAVFITSFYFAHLIGMGKAKVLITEEGISHIWQRRFFLSWERSFKISWNMVDNYVFHEDRTFDSFIVNLKNKTRYKVNRLNVLHFKDDFYQLVREFPRLSNEYKNGVNSNFDAKQIKEGESVYASKSFLWVFYFMSTIFLILVVNNVFNSYSETSWYSLGVIGSGLLFYGLMIRSHRKNN